MSFVRNVGFLAIVRNVVCTNCRGAASLVSVRNSFFAEKRSCCFFRELMFSEDVQLKNILDDSKGSQHIPKNVLLILFWCATLVSIPFFGREFFGEHIYGLCTWPLFAVISGT